MQAQKCKVRSATKRTSSSGLHSRVSLTDVLFHLAGKMTALQDVSEASMVVYGMFYAPATLHAVSAVCTGRYGEMSHGTKPTFFSDS